MSRRPVVAIPANLTRDIHDEPIHSVKHQYIRPLVEIVGAAPLILPAIGGEADLAGIDGILLTGAPSHLNPCNYGAARDFGDEFLDDARDSTSLPVIRAAIARDIPVFAICRGFQELNVVCGGTLHQYVHKVDGRRNHQPPRDVPREKWYETPQHKVGIQQGGLFARLGLPADFAVNSLHTQGVDKVGNDLLVEAIAEDGTIEAVSLPGKRFVMGTQWHPEGDFWLNPPNRLLFEAFSKALK